MTRIRLLPLILLFAVGTILGQDEEFNGIRGTETPESQETSETGKCFVFSRYIVKTVESEDLGENVAVYKRGTATSAESACQTTGKPYLDIRNSDIIYFFGLSGTYLFIDSGTSADSRGLAIYSLATRKPIFTESYSGDPKLTEGRYLFFDSPSDKKGPLKACKQAAKWKRDGGGVGWVQGKKLDLTTLKAISVGGLRCVYME